MTNYEREQIKGSLSLSERVFLCWYLNFPFAESQSQHGDDLVALRLGGCKELNAHCCSGWATANMHDKSRKSALRASAVHQQFAPAI